MVSFSVAAIVAKATTTLQQASSSAAPMCNQAWQATQQAAGKAKEKVAPVGTYVQSMASKAVTSVGPAARHTRAFVSSGTAEKQGELLVRSMDYKTGFPEWTPVDAVLRDAQFQLTNAATGHVFAVLDMRDVLSVSAFPSETDECFAVQLHPFHGQYPQLHYVLRAPTEDERINWTAVLTGVAEGLRAKERVGNAFSTARQAAGDAASSVQRAAQPVGAQCRAIVLPSREQCQMRMHLRLVANAFEFRDVPQEALSDVWVELDRSTLQVSALTEDGRQDKLLTIPVDEILAVREHVLEGALVIVQPVNGHPGDEMLDTHDVTYRQLVLQLDSPEARETWISCIRGAKQHTALRARWHVVNEKVRALGAQLVATGPPAAQAHPAAEE